jgi:hypothetical protein
VTFTADYEDLEDRFRQQVEMDREIDRLEEHREIFLPMSFFPEMPDDQKTAEAVFIGMYPSQNWLTSKGPSDRLAQARARIASGFRISLSTIWDLVFHLGIREFLCRTGETYYVTDICKGAMKPVDEGANRQARWRCWYPLLKDEMKLVLGHSGTLATPVIPVGGDVERFLLKVGFGSWLKDNNPGHLTRRITHWAARLPQGWQTTDSFSEKYGERMFELADELLDEVGADDWWREHVHDNFGAIVDPNIESQCAWLIGRYEDEYREIRG